MIRTTLAWVAPLPWWAPVVAFDAHMEPLMLKADTMKERTYRACSPEETLHATPSRLRERFQCGGLFEADAINLAWWEVDRTVVGAAVPVAGPLSLKAPDFMKAETFCDRRELGVLNIGGPGTVTVDGETHVMALLDGLYIGKGSGQIEFMSKSGSDPARFYLLSYPAHSAFPVRKVPRESVEPLELGSGETANERKLYKVIHPGSLESCQLVMGYTQILPGSVWNTMPPHTHERRSEVYCYFGMAEDALVVHLMGEPAQTRHLMMRKEEIVFSPVWSIHAGAGTAAYSFIWGMGGENQDFTDMDHCDLNLLG